MLLKNKIDLNRIEDTMQNTDKILVCGHKMFTRVHKIKNVWPQIIKLRVELKKTFLMLLYC